MSTTHNKMRPQIEAPVKRDQAEMVLAFYGRRLAEALARRPGCRDDAERMVVQMEVANHSAHLRTSIETCRVLKVRQGLLTWQVPANITQLLEIAGRA